MGHARAQARLDAATKNKKSPLVIRKLGREAGAAEELVDAADADLRGESVNWRHEIRIPLFTQHWVQRMEGMRMEDTNGV